MVREVAIIRNAGVWVGLVLLIFSGTIFWQALSYDYFSAFGPGPGLFPLWLSGALIVVSILYIIESVRKEKIKLSEIFPRGSELRKVISIIASLVIFLILVPFSGYITASIIMLLILFFREYKWYWGLVISIVITLSLFYTFETFLNVPLPENSFGL
jgi:putative tricarboxylic transport membrane protein